MHHDAWVRDGDIKLLSAASMNPKGHHSLAECDSSARTQRCLFSSRMILADPNSCSVLGLLPRSGPSGSIVGSLLSVRAVPAPAALRLEFLCDCVHAAYDATPRGGPGIDEVDRISLCCVEAEVLSKPDGPVFALFSVWEALLPNSEGGRVEPRLEAAVW